MQIQPRFLIPDIRALWPSALSARVPECQKLKMLVGPGWHWTLRNVTICMMPLRFKGLIKFQVFAHLQPPVDSSLKIINRSFQHAAPHLWNNLPPTLHVPYQSGASSSPSSSPSSYSDPGPLVDIPCGVFHFRLITSLFSKSFPPQPSISCSASSPGIWPLGVWQSLAVAVLVSAAD